MKTSLQLTTLAVWCLTTSAAAQDPASPVSDALRAMEQRAAKNLIAAAEAMPADKYGFKPTPAQMSVGEVVVHLSEGNDFLCSRISGVAAPKRSPVTAQASKETLVGRLRETFGFCESALAKVDDSKLDAKVPFFGNREVSRAQAILVTVEDWGDHYSQLAIYLRLNGLLPPTAKRPQS
jgi:uncharacterized damage-inducible protein DinB